MRSELLNQAILVELLFTLEQVEKLAVIIGSHSRLGTQSLVLVRDCSGTEGLLTQEYQRMCLVASLQSPAVYSDHRH